MQEASMLESVLERDRTIVIAGLVTVIVLSWIYILMGAGMGMTAFEMTTMTLPGTSSQMDMAGHGSDMSAQQGMGGAMRMAHAAMMQPAVWTPSYAILMFLMWWIMMIAMMLPSASPISFEPWRHTSTVDSGGSLRNRCFSIKSFTIRLVSTRCRSIPVGAFCNVSYWQVFLGSRWKPSF